jgi:xylulokinase
MHYLLGVDAGTSSVKVSLTDEDGRTTSASSARFGIEAPFPGWAEQEPDMWWRRVRETIEEVCRICGVARGDRLSVGFTGQMHSLVLLDENHQPLRPSILWCDERSTAQAARIGRDIPHFKEVTGNTPIPAFTLPQLLWVRENEPEVFDRTTSVLVPKDYLRFRATGEMGTEWTDASATGMFDSRTRKWAAGILADLGLDQGLLPDVHAPHDLAGDVHGMLPAGVTAESSFGVGDQFAEALSSGLLEPGQASIVLGTSAVVLGVEDHQMPGTFCHAPEDRWLRLDSLHAGGMSLNWFRDRFAPRTPITDLLNEAASAPAGCDGLLYLPFLASERTSGGLGPPGGFVGARHEHQRSHFIRAILEGVAFEVKRLSGRQNTTHVQDPTLKGGGAQSPLWREIFSGVFNHPIRISSKDASFGAAMTAGLAAGWWSRYADVDLKPAAHVVPDRIMAGVYAERYEVYEDLVRRMSGVAQ